MSNIKSKLEQITEHTILGQAIVFAQRLDIFKALAEFGSQSKPATAMMIAEKCNYKERYVQELLSCLSCGEIIETDNSGKAFWMNKNNAEFFTGQQLPHIFGILRMVTNFPFIFADLEEVFQKDGPLGLDYKQYKEVHQCVGSCTESKYKDQLISCFLPLTGLDKQLKHRPLKVLNIGCGAAYQIIQLARKFPLSHFVGVDSDNDVIKLAKQNHRANNISNVEFLKMSATELPSGWTRTYDWVTIFDSCHDFARPEECLQSIRRILKRDGVLTMVDANGIGNAYLDKNWDKTNATIGYGLSVFHCLPIGSNAQNGYCLGTMWGQKRALELLEKCGFPNVQLVPLPFASTEVLYICKKAKSSED